MKQLWIFIIAVFCTLTLFGQRQNSDSTHPPKKTSASKQTGDSINRGRKTTPTNGTTVVRAKDSGTAAEAPANNRAAAGDTSQKIPRPGKPGTGTAAAIPGAATGGISKNDSIQLTPAQLEVQQQELEKRQLKEHTDSIYNAHKSQLLTGLSTASIIKSNDRPDYSVYFPDYFYDNSNKGGSNGALVSYHAYLNRDLLFYAFIGITLLLALTKVIFPRYFNQIFWFFLHPNDRKNNVSEQMHGQNVIPSLLLNLFFVLTGGLFLAQILRPNLPGADFWASWALFSLLLIGVYLVKYLVILLSGWVFGVPVAATIYNQVVFSINKIIGLLLLPATLLIGYGTVSTLGNVFSTVCVIISILLIYRYIASFLLIKGKLKVSAFHFILYLCAVEIIPLLLVYKVLLTNLGRFM